MAKTGPTVPSQIQNAMALTGQQTIPSLLRAAAAAAATTLVKRGFDTASSAASNWLSGDEKMDSQSAKRRRTDGKNSKSRSVLEARTATISSGCYYQHVGPTGHPCLRSIAAANKQRQDTLLGALAAVLPMQTFMEETSGCAGIWANDRQGESTTWTDCILVNPENSFWNRYKEIHATTFYEPGKTITQHYTERRVWYANNGPRKANFTCWRLTPRESPLVVAKTQSDLPGANFSTIGSFGDMISGPHSQSLAHGCFPPMFNNGRGALPGVGPSSFTPDVNHYQTQPHDSRTITEKFNISPEFDMWLAPGEQVEVRMNQMLPFKFDPLEWNLPLLIADETKAAWGQTYLWTKELGPIYFFRLRGQVVHDESKRVAPDFKLDDTVNMSVHQLDWVQNTKSWISGENYDESRYPRDRFSSNELITTKGIVLANESAYQKALSELSGNDT